MRGFFFTCLLFFGTLAQAQSPTADFTINGTACVKQNLKPVNLSSNATRYEWDYCQGDLATTPDPLVVKKLGGTVTTGVDLVFDGTNWFGFVTSQNTNAILRLDFGIDIFSTPVVTSLGNVGGNTNSPTDIKVVNENGNWYGFVYNLSAPMISRINFGSSLTNTATLTADPIVNGNGSINGGFDLMNDGSNWTLVLTNSSVFTIVRMPTITGTPAGADIITTGANPFGSQMGDVVLVRSNNNYYGYVVAFGNKTLQRLSFGTSLFTTPAIDNIPLSFLNSYSPYGIDIGYDDGKYYLIVSTLEGKIIRIAMGSDLSTISATASLAGDSPLFENTLKVRTVKHKTNWLVFATSWQSTNLFRLAFQNPVCNTVTEGTSPVFSFDAAATRTITLRSFNSSGVFAEATRIVTVNSAVAPSADFTINGICSTSPTQFNATSPDAIVSYNWKFGDAATSTGQVTSHQYAAGTYNVELIPLATNGCSNSIFKPITTYNKPVADFAIPSGLICTNNLFSFSNQTPGNFDGNLTYEWSVNGGVVATTRDLGYLFTAQGNNDVKLKVSLPGCFTETTKSISNVLPGPTVGFTYTGNCENDVFAFTNTSSGSISGYNWTFDSDGSSTAINPTHQWPGNGSYVVTLSTSAPNGCVSTTGKTINVYSLPKPAFSIDLPPFSCSGTPSQFHDATPSMNDSNVQNWNWAFGDNGNGVGKDPTHTYLNAGPYTVTLSVTTDRGCTNSFSQPVTITQSPIASLTSDPTCVNQVTHFKDGSTGGVVSWQWKVGTTSYTAQNPNHTFSAPGNYNVQLVVTGVNACTASITKTVTVPVVPTIDFQVTNPCSAQDAVFNDVTNNPSDPVAQRTWTFNNTGTATGQQASFNFTNAGSFPVQLVVQGQSGCSYSITKQVLIKTSPAVSFSASDLTGPPPLNVVFTNTSTGAASYVWALGDGAPNSTSVSLEHTFASLGDYNVSLTATSSEGCSKTETKLVRVISPVEELSIEDFLLKQSSPNSSYQGYVQVRNNGNYRVTSFVVNYDVGGGILLTEVVPADLSVGESKTFTLSTTFNAPAQASFVCAELTDDTDDNNNKACFTFSDRALIFDVNPNPASEFVNIESVHPDASDIRVQVFNMSGRLAYDKTFETKKGLSQLSLDIQNLSPGMYIVVITSGPVSSSQKILISR